jgi:hypothetical protein
MKMLKQHIEQIIDTQDFRCPALNPDLIAPRYNFALGESSRNLLDVFISRTQKIQQGNIL